MKRIEEYLTESAREGLLPWTAQVEAAGRYALSLAEVEETALSRGLFPARYQRNRRMIDTAGQLRLFRSSVCVVGCGGLGGYVVEELARLGVGTITAVDPDVFEEHNLNRQLYSLPSLLGEVKVEVVRKRVAEVNPAVRLVPIREAFGGENGAALLAGSDVAVDALDNVTARLALAEACTERGVPLVHGAIGGWFGQIVTQMPGERSIERLYVGREDGFGVEKQLGNPSFTPAVVASIQVAEVCKLLLGTGKTLGGRKLSIDLLAMETHEIEV